MAGLLHSDRALTCSYGLFFHAKSFAELNLNFLLSTAVQSLAFMKSSNFSFLRSENIVRDNTGKCLLTD